MHGSRPWSEASEILGSPAIGITSSADAKPFMLYLVSFMRREWGPQKARLQLRQQTVTSRGGGGGLKVSPVSKQCGIRVWLHK